MTYFSHFSNNYIIITIYLSQYNVIKLSETLSKDNGNNCLKGETMNMVNTFKKEKLILMETLRGVPFITNIKESSIIPPSELFMLLKENGVAINFDKFFLAHAALKGINAIFQYEQHNGETESALRIALDEIMKMLNLFEESKFIIEEYEHKDISEYVFHDNEDYRLVREFFVDAFARFEKNDSIFMNSKTESMVQSNQLKNKDIDVSATKITAMYGNVMLADIAYDAALRNGISENGTMSLALTSEIMNMMNQPFFEPTKRT